MFIKGVYRSTPSTLTMVDCETRNCFTDCTGGVGYGGTYRTEESSSGPNFDITMTRCSIHDNVSDNWAGAICYNLPSVPLKLNNCTINDNHGDYGGLYCQARTEVNDCTITGNSAKINGGGIYIGGTGEDGNGVVTLSGTVIVDNNQKIGSVIENNVFVDQTGWRVVYIGEAGLECGSSIGISNRPSDHLFAQGEGSAAVAALNGNNAYRNHYFFDDNGVCTAVNTDAEYPTRPSEPYYDGYGSNLWFYDKAFIAGYLDSWHDQSATAGTDYVLTDGYVSEVKTAAGLAYFSKDVLTHDYTGKTVTLSNDISLAGHNWEPIGYKDACGTINHSFTGTFDGQGHTISNINCPFQYDNVGLFGCVEGGTVKNVMVGGAITASHVVNAGGIVGQLNGGTVSDSYSFVEMDVKWSAESKLGGIVGTIVSGSLNNSFANPKFTVTYGAPNVGGLVGVNTGQIENCYVRLERLQSFGSAHFGMLAGSNTGSNTITYCYAPNGDEAQFDHSYSYLYGGATTGLANCDLYNKVIAPYLYNNSNDNTLVNASASNLLKELNRWVASHDGHSQWKRTRAGGYITGQDINGDYPIHKYDDYHCVASNDGITLHYATTLDNMLTSHNTPGTTINLYTADAVDVSGNNAHTTTASDVVVYVDEDVCVLPAADKNVRANTCQTLRTYASSRWHDVSSSLQDSKIGFTYGLDGQPFSWLPNPCNVTLESPNNESLFPKDLGDLTSCDLYCFYEPEYHWLNLKRNTNSHWHMNAQTVKINYIGNGTGGDGNEDHLVPGKGYLVSVNKDQLLENEGILNRDDVTVYNVTKTNFNAWAERLGFNLLGNPYQSYLDFEVFKTVNGTSLWDNGSEVSEYNNTFAIFDPSLNSYVQYKNGTSYGSYGATQFIHPHQGFFIRMTKGSNSTNTTTVTYTNAMRSLEGDGGEFRGEERPAYPLINFLVRDSEGNGDVAVLELSRGNVEGASKMHLGECTGKISLGYEGEEYGILFRTEVLDYQPLHFKAGETGTFTLEWNTANGTFEALTLIDNIAGTTTDMLAHDSYSFEGNPDQYSARFKVVVGDYKGIDEPEEDGPSTGSGTFAFQMGDQLVVNGEGNLQIIDMLGRVVMTDQLTGSQSTTNLPKTAGVYVLRLTDTNGTRTQKMVIR